MTLSEKYRPKTLAEVVGQDKAIATLTRLAPNWGGRAWWVTGKSGIGKSSIARIIAEAVAGSQWGITEKVGRQLTTTDLRTWADNLKMSSWLSEGYALIVNEAHGMSRPVIEVLLDVLEHLPAHSVVVFTTTIEGAELFEEHLDAGPFRSRCHHLALTSQGLSPKFAKHLHTIADAEGLNGQPESAYVGLVNRCHGNLRECLAQIEEGRMLT